MSTSAESSTLDLSLLPGDPQIARQVSPSAAGLCDDGRMATWSELAAAEPDFARRVHRLFADHKHHTMATIRLASLSTSPRSS